MSSSVVSLAARRARRSASAARPWASTAMPSSDSVEASTARSPIASSRRRPARRCRSAGPGPSEHRDEHLGMRDGGVDRRREAGQHRVRGVEQLERAAELAPHRVQGGHLMVHERLGPRVRRAAARGSRCSGRTPRRPASALRQRRRLPARARRPACARRRPGRPPRRPPPALRRLAGLAWTHQSSASQMPQPRQAGVVTRLLERPEAARRDAPSGARRLRIDLQRASSRSTCARACSAASPRESRQPDRLGERLLRLVEAALLAQHAAQVDQERRPLGLVGACAAPPPGAAGSPPPRDRRRRAPAAPRAQVPRRVGRQRAVGPESARPSWRR